MPSVSTQIQVSSLVVEAPARSISIPLPIPVSIPASWLSCTPSSKTPADLESANSRRIVDDVSCSIKSGQVHAILGGSGSGKTTLLHAIANRSPSNLSVYSAKGKDQQPIQRVSSGCAFVPQEPRFLPKLTCRESVDYTAALKLPGLAAERRQEIVQSVLSDLGMLDAADTRVAKCSGGEQRRLTIACALVTSPDIIILDEATTGLDAHTALQILLVLERLAADKHKTIILSLHAPRSDAMQIIDRLIILTRGKVAFEGTTQDATPWFESHGYPLPERINPLDFIIDITSVDTRSDAAEVESRKRVTALVSAWREAQPAPHKLSEQHTAFSPTSSTGSFQQENPNPILLWIKQTSTLTNRALLCNWRDVPQTAGFAAQFIILSVIIGLAFYNPPQDPGGIQTMKTALFQNIVATYYLSFLIGVYIFCDLFLVYDRESEDKLYSAPSFIISLFISYLPLHTIFPMLYAVIFYFLAGFRLSSLASSIWVYIGANILQQIGSFGYASIWASLNRNFAQASLYANGFIILFLLSTGYLILPDSIPVYVKWIRWINPFYYGFVWTAKSQFEGRQLGCSEAQCTGEAILTALQISLSSPKWVYAVGLAAYTVISHAIAALILAFFHAGGVRHAPKNELLERVNEGIQLPDTPIAEPNQLVLQNVLVKAKDRQILSIPFCVFQSGRVAGVLGPSGAGKSTALRLLSSHVPGGLHVNGQVWLNNNAIHGEQASTIAFVPQSDDHLLPALTVRETLVYAARLRQHGLAKQQAEVKAEEVLRVLGLKTCAETIVGNDALKGISGGEKRRLSLGMDLVGDPSVLICDEPTSGLDAAQSLAVMECLARIASGFGCAVIASLHQPRAAIFQQVDDLLLLAQGGQVAYAGPRCDVVKHFKDCGLDAPAGWTVADWVLDMVTTAKEQLLAQQQAQEKHVLDGDRSPTISGRPRLFSAFRTRPFYHTFPVVLSRSFRNLARQQDIFVARLANAPFLALLFCLFFQRLGDAPGDVQNRIGILQENSALPFVGMIANLALFPSERDSLLHDYLSPGRYSPTVFMLSFCVQEVPLQVVASILYSLLVVFVIIQDYGAANLFEFFVGIFCLLNFGESIGIIFSTWVTSGALSVSLVSVGLTISTQISGIYSVTVPGWLRGIGKAFPFTWSSQVVLVNQFSGRVFDCSEEDVTSGACIAETGDQFLEAIRVQTYDTGRAIGIMLGLTIAFRVLAVGSLYVRVWRAQH